MKQPVMPGMFEVPTTIDMGKLPSAEGLADGMALRDRGQAVAESHTDEELTAEVWKAAKIACRQFREVTSDEVWFVFNARNTFTGQMPKRLNLMGAVMRKAQTMRWMEPTGRSTKTKRADGHARAIPVYRSLIYGAE